ncbi:MAG: ABC transporter ATP-binding protein [Acidobacteria bacterium]|nr:ABC transporter ATP-binding protein [Acidobacteriota bacterium]
MIELRSLCRTYRMGSEDVHALANVTLSIKKGEHIAVVGPSGSGKSTLLNILGCLDRPTSGSYRFSGQEVAELGEVELSGLRQRWIGFVFQFFHLLPRLDAVGNVEVPMLFAGVEREERRRRARWALEAVGLEHRLRHKPEELSGGERQRVAIARSVVMGPRLLLADEPTGNLDRHSAEEIMDLIERMNAEGLTLIVVTHDPAIAQRAGRIVRLEDGRVVEGGPDIPPQS